MAIAKKFQDRINTTHPYTHSSKTDVGATIRKEQARLRALQEAQRTSAAIPLRAKAKKAV